MIVDSSAIVAIFFQEEGFEALTHKLAEADEAGIGAPTLVEASIVLSARLGQDARPILARFLDATNIVVVPFSKAHFGMAVGAWLKYGKGQHPAGLNYGDCLAYAVSKATGAPLLCVGEDFPKTDLPLA
jgi:ribonuclease VapC